MSIIQNTSEEEKKYAERDQAKNNLPKISGKPTQPNPRPIIQLSDRLRRALNELDLKQVNYQSTEGEFAQIELDFDLPERIAQAHLHILEKGINFDSFTESEKLNMIGLYKFQIYLICSAKLLYTLESHVSNEHHYLRRLMKINFDIPEHLQCLIDQIGDFEIKQQRCRVQEPITLITTWILRSAFVLSNTQRQILFSQLNDQTLQAKILEGKKYKVFVDSQTMRREKANIAEEIYKELNQPRTMTIAGRQVKVKLCSAKYANVVQNVQSDTFSAALQQVYLHYNNNLNYENHLETIGYRFITDDQFKNLLSKILSLQQWMKKEMSVVKSVMSSREVQFTNEGGMSQLVILDFVASKARTMFQMTPGDMQLGIMIGYSRKVKDKRDFKAVYESNYRMRRLKLTQVLNSL